MPMTPERFAARVERTLQWGRESAESRMTSTCTITRPGGWDEDGEQAEPVVIYSGMCREATHQPYETTPDAGGQTRTEQRYGHHIPAIERLPALVAAGRVQCVLEAMPVREGDVITRTTPGRPQITMTVAGDHDKDDQTAQRLLVDRS